MDATAGGSKPNFCGECGGKLGSGERFCGECGSAVAESRAFAAPTTTRAPSSAQLANPFLPALLLGGFWTMSNRLASRGVAVWLALALSILWLLSWVPLALWWVAFMFGHREYADVRNLETITTAWVGIPLAALLINLPLARRSSSLLVAPEPERQLAQVRKGLVLYAAVFVVGAITWAMDERISFAISQAQAAKLGK